MESKAREANVELVRAIAEPWICVEDKPCEETVVVHWEELLTSLSAAFPSAEATAPYCPTCGAPTAWHYKELREENGRLRAELATARAGAIRECVEQLNALQGLEWNGQLQTMTGVIDGGYIGKVRAVNALESLTKGEGDDGPTV